MYHLRDIKNKNKFARLRNAEGGGYVFGSILIFFAKFRKFFVSVIFWCDDFLSVLFCSLQKKRFLALNSSFFGFHEYKKDLSKVIHRGGGYIFRSILIFFAKFREFFVSVTFWCNDFFYLKLFYPFKRSVFRLLSPHFLDFMNIKKDLSKVIHWRTLRSLRMTIFNS